MKGLLEIVSNKMWMVDPDFLHNARKVLEYNLNTHTPYSREKKCSGFVSEVRNGAIIFPEEYQISDDGKKARGNWALSAVDEHGNSCQDFPFVSVLTVDGPVTRNGGGCSYGSIDHRDMMMRAADHPLCCGHLFIINTPGGSAWAVNDYQQAIDYARSKGQPVLAFIDGMCASAGMYLASMCDERYYMHPKDLVGCIGAMVAFYTEKDGEKNQYTNETYHEMYDPESFDKNKKVRDIVYDGDSKELLKELADLGVEFRAAVLAGCPNAKDEHLHGKIFDAKDVDGILVDGLSSFDAVVKRCFALFRGEVAPIKREPVSSSQKKTGGNGAGNKKEINQTNNINMENYPLINAACGMSAGDMVVKEDGAHMDVTLLDAIEQKLGEQENMIASFQEQGNKQQEAIDAAVAEAIKEKDAAHAEELARLNKEHEQAMATAEEKHQTDFEALNKQLEEANGAIAKANEELTSVQADLQGAKEALAAAEQKLADKDAQIAELTNAPGADSSAGASPANEGAGVGERKMVVGVVPQNFGNDINDLIEFKQNLKKSGIV